ncbi:MAG: NarK/NasA family nitrate transporter [Acidobacteria bacterium]|nr:NarK/NasA family nitrate transporter [Acidobacteriota bacterium]
MTDNGKALSVLTLNTLAFTVCFACWMMNGVLVTFLVDNKILDLDKAQIGWLIGIPVLTGSIIRLPLGVLTDRFGGRIVFGVLMLISAVPTYLLSYCSTYRELALASLGFGLSGGSFAIGIAYTSVWFSKERQGTALGIFGMGNAGSALTSLGAPTLLRHLTDGGQNLDGWRTMPKIYAASLVIMSILFFLLTHSKRVEHSQEHGLLERLKPLKHIRVWRFGLYYFFVFGGFVALAQWLIPYYVNAYAMSLALAGLMATIFNLPSGVIRALGGYLSDKYGARPVMYWVFGTSLLCCILLCVPRMDIESPGEGVMAFKKGTVQAVSPSAIVVDDVTFPVRPKVEIDPATRAEGLLVLPNFTFWQEPVVKTGDVVKKRQILARGVTHIFFQANVWIFTALVFALGIGMGIGKAGVYKYIPDYFPKDVGVVGGIVGVIGGLGGFVCPIIFGYLLKWTGIWTTCWMFFFALVLICHLWMHVTVRRLLRERAPILARQIEDQQLVQEIIGKRG